MNILFLAPRLPYPADTGGKIRTFNILKQLAMRASVHLVCFTFDESDKVLSDDLKRDGIEVTLVPAKDLSLVEKIKRVLSDPLPVSISKYYSPEMETILSELNETNQYDMIHVDHLHMAHYRHCFDGIPCVMDEHNVEYKILERCANVEKNPVKNLVFKNQTGKMKDFEMQKVNDFSAYLAVSQDDKNLLDDLGEEQLSGYVIPNGVDTEYFKPPVQFVDRSADEENLVFTGSMDWLPNSDSALFFIQEVLPLIWKRRPEVKFTIVGKNPPINLQKAAMKDQRITLTGRVDDVRPFVVQSKIFVVPLRIGGGTRLKILEAMSMNKAVVSTSIGAEGIDYTEGSNIVLADKPQEFADKIIDLLQDKQKQEELGTAGRKLVLEQYDWNIIGRKLADIYGQIKE